MTGFFAAVVRKVIQIFVILAADRFLELGAFHCAITYLQPFFHFRTKLREIA